MLFINTFKISFTYIFFSIGDSLDVDINCFVEILLLPFVTFTLFWIGMISSLDVKNAPFVDTKLKIIKKVQKVILLNLSFLCKS